VESFLFLVAGAVIGLIAGWLIRGSRPGTAKPADTPTPVESTSSSAAAVPAGLVETPTDTTTAPITEHAAEPTEPTGSAKHAAEPAGSTTGSTGPAAESTSSARHAAEPADETVARPVTEPAEAGTPAAEPATVRAATEPEPVAVTEPAEVAAIEPIEETVVIEPVAETVVIEPTAETVVIEPAEEPAATIVKTAEAEPIDETVAIEPAAEPVTAGTTAGEVAGTTPAVPVPGVAGTEAVVPTAAPIAVAVQEPDDLTKIAGIGPKMAMALAAGGITTYRKLADSDLPSLRAAVTGAGMRLAPSLPTWPQQAKLLVDTTS
jgi:predicted flap endonuclease-1-like 5' DNA nuclease